MIVAVSKNRPHVIVAVWMAAALVAGCAAKGAAPQPPDSGAPKDLRAPATAPAGVSEVTADVAAAIFEFLEVESWWSRVGKGAIEPARAYFLTLWTPLLPGFRADIERLREAPWLAPVTRTSDAGPLLNPLMHWEGEAAVLDAWKARTASLSSTVLEPDAALVAKADVWLNGGTGAPFTAEERSRVAWMASALRHDHWRLESGPAQFLPEPRFGGGGLRPNVDSKPAKEAARIRLAIGVADRDVGPAVREVRHFARLCLSTGDLFLGMHGIRILLSEAMLAEGMPRNATAAVRWEAPDTELRAVASAVWWVSAEVFSAPWLPVEELKAMLLRMPDPLRCGVISDAAGLWLPMRPLIESVYPQYTALLVDEVRSQACHEGRLRRWANLSVADVPPEFWETLFESTSSEPVGRVAEPNQRKAIGELYRANWRIRAFAVDNAIAVRSGGWKRAAAQSEARREVVALSGAALALLRNGKSTPRLTAAPLSPDEPFCTDGKPRLFQATTATFDHPSWKALAFRPPERHMYKYELAVETVGDVTRFTARALGDLDCNGVYSTFERVGAIEANGRVWSGVGLFEEKEAE